MATLSSEAAQLLAARSVIAEIQNLHREKHGEGEHGPYVICDYDKTQWPCRTQAILSRVDPAADPESELHIQTERQRKANFALYMAAERAADKGGWIASYDCQQYVDAIDAADAGAQGVQS